MDATKDGIRKKRGNKVALKKLRNFLMFDYERFAKGKRLLSVSQQPWKDFKTSEVLGTKIETVIALDKTNYGLKDGEVVSNLYEKLVFKIPKVIEIPMNVEIRPKNPVATVYGDYQNQLSITAEDIEVLSK